MIHTDAHGAPRPPDAISVLAVGLPEQSRAGLAALLRSSEFRLRFAVDAAQAQRAIETACPRLLLVEAAMAGAAALLRACSDRRAVPGLVVCRGDEERRLLVELLEAGALDALPCHVLEPNRGLVLSEARVLFLDTLRDASSARLKARCADAVLRAPLSHEPFVAPIAPRRGHELPTLIVLAGATGGVQALRVVLAGLPSDTPGIVVAQHGSQAFVEAARIQLASGSHLRVRIARHGDHVEPGLALLAPGNRHMRTLRRGSGYRVSISDGPLVARRRPSADVLLQSASEAAGSAAIGVILSGAGRDGCDGAAALKRSLGATLAQDEGTSIAFGMPSAAALHGAIDMVAADRHLSALLLERAANPRGRA